ncbi:hypothetical protein Pla100_04310 [Neorhodopirellula pilleata]|uniref:Uncharacterized protein n=1 Tax=Neorhodopirellula pilleata TaxID=2714738 RepID=A0A5C6AZC5_9BACT|nr:hypothetical protein Pla100_04310 [Neorhodopirellula pilleata]
MRAWSRTAGKLVTMRCFGRSRQSVVLGGRDVELAGGSGSSGQQVFRSCATQACGDSLLDGEVAIRNRNNS